MSNPKIEFAVKPNDQGVSQLHATLSNDEGLADTDIRLKFARLAMIYAGKVSSGGALGASSSSLGDRTLVTLTFINKPVHGDGHEFMEFDDDFEGPDYFNEPDDGEDVTDNKSVGFTIKVDGIENKHERPLGWAASPAYVAATLVAKMTRTAIEQAAGVSYDEDRAQKPLELAP